MGIILYVVAFLERDGRWIIMSGALGSTSRMREVIDPLPLVIDGHCRVLILGSMPSDLSIAKQQYYANPRNQFWPIIHAVLGGGDPPVIYEDRIRFLLSKRIALWDVLERCERAGSSDASIIAEVPNDFSTIFASYSEIKFVFFNGKKAYESFLRTVPIPRGISLWPLPSTSPANAAKSMPQKLKEWRKIDAALTVARV